MQFSGADIIVITIVVIVLFVYRQLDRNNRSLEKVKKYADRVHDELEAHVQDKVVAIKDMGIELEVHQKAAKEVLKRVQAIESGLNSRAEEIERIGTRIGQYDAALDELVQMTARAQENIDRVREESSYVDTVGRRIKQSQERLSAVEKGLDEVGERFRSENEAHLRDVRADVLSEAAERVESIRDELGGFQERVNQFEEFVRGAEERAESLAARSREELEEIGHTVVHRAQEASIQSSEQLSEIREQLEVLETDYQKRLLGLAERGEAMETEALSNLRKRIDTAAQEAVREMTGRLEHQKRALHERIDAALVELDQAETRLAERDKRLDATRAGIDRRIEGFGSELNERVDQAAADLQRQILGDIEERLSDYESQITYRFERLGDVGAEVEELEGRLHDAMNQVVSRVRGEFTQFTDEFKASRDRDRSAVQEEMTRVRDQMAELESGLSDLKNRAYENVNEKLQVFEDEFFSDLRERQVAMEQRLVDWQAAFRQELDDVATSARDERAQIEADYTGEVKRQLENLQSTAYGTYEKIEEEVVEFQRGIELRVSDSRELIASLEREIEDEIQQLAAESKSGLRSEFSQHREQMAAELNELDRSVRRQIEELGREFDAGRSELESVLEQSRGEASTWKNQVDQRLQSTSAEVNQQIADFRVSMGETLSELRDAFSGERDEALAENAAERDRLQRELDDLTNRVGKITDEIRMKSTEALAEFGERYSELRLDTEKQVKAFGADIDARIKEFRTMVQDSRDQFAANQERLLGKLNEEANALGSNLQEIEKQQRNFVDQTRLFERADEIKEDLSQEIAELKGDLERVESQRKDLREIEAQFSRLRKSADDVNDKMNRFVSEKRRIDALEDDYKKLLSMSQAVELKLEHVTASNDSLQAMQASLRSLEQLEKDVEGKFQRLEKKRSILDLTTEGVDKNFQSLQEIETRLAEITSQVNVVPDKIEELSRRVGQLASNKRDADAAVKQLALLDQTLEEIEERMENLNQAREWLARTETRLEEVQREAEEQVKLLGAIMKQEHKGSGGKDGGAPPVTTRDTVIKLARQSWNVDEIARATSLSRGEVELILELAAK
ncbi:MAG: SpiroCoCo family coiled-coil protein [Spirochaetota bacterium]